MQQLAGPLSAGMAAHILLMNAFAPALALAGWRMARRWRLERQAVLAMTLQLALVWGWHSPPVLAAAAVAPGLEALMQVTLFMAALLFWAAVFAHAGNERWRAIAILLVTGKVFCLLGILFVFAPRPLCPGLATMDDQQLAGMMMLVACPATYVAAGVGIAARWFAGLERADGILRSSRDAA